MGGIMGRLFREFSVVLAMTILVSAVVSLTLTPMMASRFLKSASEEHHGKLFQASERFFDGLLAGYETVLDLALRYQFATCPAPGDRRHALRCIRPAAGDAVFHPDQRLSGDHGSAARAAG